MNFFCKSAKCKIECDGPYETHIPVEVYDRHNMATLFCPHCGSELEKKVTSISEATE